jgi:hypothetical protein
MSTRETHAWLSLVASVLGSALLGLRLFGHWPDVAWFALHRQYLAQPVAIVLVAYLLATAVAYQWRHGPLDDERDRLILGAAAMRGFLALALFNVLGGMLLARHPALVADLGAAWLRYALLWVVLLSGAVASAWQVWLYRRG